MGIFLPHQSVYHILNDRTYNVVDMVRWMCLSAKPWSYSNNATCQFYPVLMHD